MAEKGKQVTRTTQQVQPENRALQFYRETISELRKVVWPTRDQAVNLTGIVIAVVVAMSLLLGAIDFALNQAIRLMLQ